MALAQLAGGLNRASLLDATRTAVAALVSLLVARMFSLPEAYWATVMTVVVMQSTLGAALKISFERLAGTALGAGLGALLAMYVGSNAMAFGAGVFVLGLICALLHVQNAFRFAAVTLAIVMLVPRVNSPAVLALHRFFEVSVGVVVALAITAVWPVRESVVPPKTL